MDGPRPPDGGPPSSSPADTGPPRADADLPSSRCLTPDEVRAATAPAEARLAATLAAIDAGVDDRVADLLGASSRTETGTSRPKDPPRAEDHGQGPPIAEHGPLRTAAGAAVGAVLEAGLRATSDADRNALGMKVGLEIMGEIGKAVGGGETLEHITDALEPVVDQISTVVAGAAHTLSTRLDPPDTPIR